MTDNELTVLRYKSAAFDAFVEKFKCESRYVGERHIPRRIQKSAYPSDYEVSVSTQHVWGLTIKIDSCKQGERPDMEQVLFALIPPMTRKLIREG